MGENTKIEWADHTFNPWIGCTRVSPACDHCHADVLLELANAPLRCEAADA
jgi:protein gp37